MLGLPLHFERVASGPPLLMVQGLGANLHTWEPVLAALSSSHELILIDLPGHGRSAPLAGRKTIDAYADALTHFIGTQGLATADLVGSSVGGRLVLELARRGIGRHCVALDPGDFLARLGNALVSLDPRSVDQPGALVAALSPWLVAPCADPYPAAVPAVGAAVVAFTALGRERASDPGGYDGFRRDSV